MLGEGNPQAGGTNGKEPTSSHGPYRDKILHLCGAALGASLGSGAGSIPAWLHQSQGGDTSSQSTRAGSSPRGATRALQCVMGAAPSSSTAIPKPSASPHVPKTAIQAGMCRCD